MTSKSSNLGPLLSLFQDSTITEIMVNSYKRIFVEKNGQMQLTTLKLPDETSLQALLHSLAKDCGRELSETRPYFDGKLPDGSRINAVLPPMSPDGATLTIRRFNQSMHSLSSLIKLGTLSEKCAYFLDAAVKARLNIVISGGTGTGKTTFLNALSYFIPESERIITIEDVSELQLQHPNWIRLESTQRKDHSITIKNCLANALRMRPDRIIVGECRRDETFEMLQAMNTGHEGSLTTLHANSPRDCLVRIESLVATSGIDYPLAALRKQIASAIDLIVQLKRDRNGQRFVSEILELTGVEQNTVTSQPIFSRDNDKAGFLCSTGLVPSVFDRFAEYGIVFPANFFDPNTKITFYPEPPHRTD